MDSLAKSVPTEPAPIPTPTIPSAPTPSFKEVREHISVQQHTRQIQQRLIRHTR